MMISSNDLRSGMTIERDGKLLQVLESAHVKPGKGPAFVRVKFRNVMTGSTTQETLRAGEKMTSAHMDKRKMEYLYRDGDLFYFMDVNTYEQQPLTAEDIGEGARFLKENNTVEVLTHKGRMVGVSLPVAVELKVVETVPGVKGDTVSGATKPATLETGAVLNVPLFVNEGDVIRVDTRSGEYMERA